MFGDVLPLALGIAVSPVPVIATILMLLSPRAKATSAAFAGGWVGGITVAIVVFDLLGGLLPDRSEDSGGVVGGLLRLVLGLLLALLAIRTFRRRPREGEHAQLPKWMSAIDDITPVKALGLAVKLALANPKNLMMAASAGISLGEVQSPGPAALAIVVFVLIAASTVVVPVIAYSVASARLAGPLDALRGWLTHNNSTIMSILLVFLAISNIGKGIDAF
jgi:threonine/homoserine/homoserine lactone efflux protein